MEGIELFENFEKFRTGHILNPHIWCMPSKSRFLLFQLRGQNKLLLDA